MRLRGRACRRVRQGAAACATGIDHHVVQREHGRAGKWDHPDSRHSASNRAVRPFTTARQCCSRRISERCCQLRRGRRTASQRCSSSAMASLERQRLRPFPVVRRPRRSSSPSAPVPQARVSVTANPASVPAAGGTTTITAAVVDASGNPLSGVPVSFATTAGTFSSVVVNTDASGTARTTLTTSQAASVTATAGGTTSTAVDITVTLAAGRSRLLRRPPTPTEGSRDDVHDRTSRARRQLKHFRRCLSISVTVSTIGPLSGSNQNVRTCTTDRDPIPDRGDWDVCER